MNSDFTHPPVKQNAWPRGLIKGSRALLILLILLLCSSAVPALGQTAGLPVSKVISAGGYEALAEKITGRGSVRLIVGVNTPFQPMANPKSAESIRQISRIASLQDALLAEMGSANLKAVHKYNYIPYMFMEADEQALNALLGSSHVISLQEDIPEPATLDLSVPRVGVPPLRNLSPAYTGTGITIAVLDTGVDKNHPFLNGAVVSEACYSSNYAPDNATTICPRGVTASTVTGSAMPYGGNCPAGHCDHGTHVTGIAAGRQNVAGSPAPAGGVAPSASVIAIQVFSRFNNDTSCGGTGTAPCVLTYPSDQIKGLERVYELGFTNNTYDIASVNMSLGGDKFGAACDSDSRKSIITNLKDAGIATVISSGNDGWCGFTGTPGCISTAVTVGATTDLDTFAGYSNSATFIDLAAPGSDIISSIPGNAYARYWGTSMAAPHVTGAWALMKQAQPSRTVDQILADFSNTGLSVTDSKCGSVTKKRINLNEALSKLRSAPYAQANAATGIGQTSATLSGIARANSFLYDASIQFQYGTTTAYGSTVPRFAFLVSGTADTPLSAAISGLAPNTLYHYRMKGTSGYGTTYSDDMTFVTSGVCGGIQGGDLEGYTPPGWTANSTHCGTPLCNVFDNPEDCATHSGYGAAMFGCFAVPELGSLTQSISIPNGASQSLQFYLDIPAYSWNDTDSYSVLIDGNPILTVFESDPLYRSGYAQASLNLSPYADGGTHSLTLYSGVTGASFFLVDDISMSCSKGTLPSVTTGDVIPVTGDEVYLTGSVNAYGSATTVKFDYGISDTYGFSLTADPGAVGINGDYPVSAYLITISPGTTYHYRIRGQNSNGIAYGRDMTFTTYCPSSGARIGVTPFSIIQTAIDTAIGNSVIKINNAAFTENLTTLLGSGTVTLKGGYDCAFGSVVGYTTVKGKITIQGSKNIIADNIIVQ